MKSRLFIILAFVLCLTHAWAQKRSNIKTREEIIVRPLLSVKIKATDGRIRKADDLSLVVTINNNSGRLQKFLLDKPGPLPHGMSCKITNAEHKSIVAAENRALAEKRVYPANTFERYHYELYAHDWLMKIYKVTDIVIFDSSIVKKGKLPPGRYSLQMNFQGNLSNMISFIAE